MTPPRFPRSAIRSLERDQFPLQTLRAIRDIRAYLAEVETRALARARDLGAGATDIAEAAGISRQAVYHRLKTLRTEDPPPVVLPDLESTTPSPD